MAYIDKGKGGRGLLGVKKAERVRRVRNIDVMHTFRFPQEVNYGFIILPTGAFQYGRITSARRGDAVRFLDGTVRVIYDICAVDVGSGLFRNLCRLRYGVEPSRVLNQWRRTAVGLGYTPDAIDAERAAVVFYKEDDGRGLLPEADAAMEAAKEALRLKRKGGAK